ncbi:hypothetical protein BDN70DRAFT_320202 [Pholiota conissans]|uniref:Uncharacterized protein n=1 Tax=Pholiota conissans TaxID=109636 RepID=A0A9P5YV37_9AGAR|nr:hypothetical protein BDN70DRAFT_320202 [Pholiota conissans]
MTSPTYTSAHTTPRLPAELFRPIIALLKDHRPTLYALCLSTHLLQHEAERHLYADLDESTAADTSLHIAFLSTITRNPRLAQLVQVYHSINIVHYQEAPLWVLLSQALRRMDNLKVLHFRMFGGHPAAELLLGAPFQLERLHWANHSEGSAMAAVLAEQQHLLYLYLESRRDTTFPPTCCPNLKELSGNRVTLEALLPGRHIEDVAWVPELQDANFGNGGGVNHLEKELTNLRTLSFGGYFARPHFGLVVDYLGRLEKLELVGLLSDELMLLKRLAPLQHLIFSFKWGSRHLQPIPVDFSQRQRLVEELFAWCPNLKCVDIAHEWTTVADIWYQRWARGGKDGERWEEREGDGPSHGIDDGGQVWAVR